MSEVVAGNTKGAKQAKVAAKDTKKPSLNVVMLLLAVLAGFGGGWLGSTNQSNTASNEANVQRQVISSEGDLYNTIAKEVGESVVSVNVVSETAVEDFFGRTRNYQSEGAGTGFIISSDGIVVTNRHVVPNGTGSVSVTLSDGTELEDVTVIGRTNDSDPLDVAFLKINDKKGKDLKSVKLAESSKVEVGDKVLAIGNALGQFQNTVTAGIISGYGREIQAASDSGSGAETLLNLFQTDASINQGNSGGPLVNMSGEVIGINTAVAGGGAENIGFSIPIDDVKALINTVLTKGKLERPYLGVRYVTITDDIAYTYNLPVKRGAYVAPSARGQSSIVKGSPAEKAGIKEKDIITKIDGEELNEKNSLVSLLGKKSVGSEVTLTIYRDGSEQQVKVTLEAAPQQ